MVINMIKIFENVSFRGMENPKCEKNIVCGVPKSLKFFLGCGNSTHPNQNHPTLNWCCEIYH